MRGKSHGPMGRNEEERDRMAADQNRPRGRERNVTGPGKTVHKRGDGLGTGPVGAGGGQSGGGQPSGAGPRGPGGKGGGVKLILLLLALLLGGSFGRFQGLDGENTGFLSDRALGDEELLQYLTDNRFPAEALLWQQEADGTSVIRLTEEQWGLVQSLELNLFYDDGEGYIDLGLDNVFQFDDEGGLLGVKDNAWLAIDGQPVAYYHTATVDDGERYSITGRVPVLHNGVRAELSLTFDDERPGGYVAGIQAVYPGGETDTVAKSQQSLQPGDVVEFLCDYYGYDGTYQDSYLLGDPVTVGEDGLTVTDVPIEGETRATYRFTDLYGQHYWTAVIP